MGAALLRNTAILEYEGDTRLDDAAGEILEFWDFGILAASFVDLGVWLELGSLRGEGRGEALLGVSRESV